MAAQAADGGCAVGWLSAMLVSEGFCEGFLLLLARSGNTSAGALDLDAGPVSNW